MLEARSSVGQSLGLYFWSLYLFRKNLLFTVNANLVESHVTTEHCSSDGGKGFFNFKNGAISKAPLISSQLLHTSQREPHDVYKYHPFNLFVSSKQHLEFRRKRSHTKYMHRFPLHIIPCVSWKKKLSFNLQPSNSRFLALVPKHQPNSWCWDVSATWNLWPHGHFSVEGHTHTYTHGVICSFCFVF